MQLAIKMALESNNQSDLEQKSSTDQSDQIRSASNCHTEHSASPREWLPRRPLALFHEGACFYSSVFAFLPASTADRERAARGARI